MKSKNTKFKFTSSTFIGLFAILASLFFLLTSAPNAHAQEATDNYDITVSPVFLDLTTNPGGTLNERIKVRNNNPNSPIPLKITVSRLEGDTEGNLTLKEDNSDGSLDWIKFEDTSIVAKPGVQTIVPFTIEVPDSAAYGYYYAVSFEQDNKGETKSSGTTISGAASVPILLTVNKKGAKAEGKLTEFSTKSFINEYLPVDFLVSVQNTGNVHIKPKGNIFITDGGDKTITTIDVNPGDGSVLPASTRDFLAAWTNGFIVREPVTEDGQTKVDENGKELKKVKIYWNKLTDFRLGKYTANLVLVYDNGQRDVPLESSVTFWVIPYKVIIGGIILLIGVILLARFLIKRYVNREVRRRMKQK